MVEGDIGNRPKLGVLLVCTLVIALGTMHYHVVGALVRPFGDAYGWSRGDVTFALTIASSLHIFTNLGAGWLADRYDPRQLAIPAITCFCAGYLVLGLVESELWTWYAAYTGYTILSAGTSHVIWTKLVVQNFDRHLGLALAVSMAGTGVLISIIPSIVVALVRELGLVWVYPALALAALLVTLVPALIFLPRAVLTPSVTSPSKVRAELGDWKVVVRSAVLWRLGLSLTFIAGSVGMFLGHFQSMLGDVGLTPEQAGQVALVMGPAMIAGRLGVGHLLDVLPPRLVAGVAFCLPGLACLWLLLLPLDFTSALALGVLIGVAMGSEVDVAAYLASRCFGAKNYGVAFGILISIYSASTGVAAWLVGKSFDRYASYDIALIALTGGIILAIMLVLTLGRIPTLGEREASD